MKDLAVQELQELIKIWTNDCQLCSEDSKRKEHEQRDCDINFDQRSEHDESLFQNSTK
jgi:hypothetical protein